MIDTDGFTNSLAFLAFEVSRSYAIYIMPIFTLFVVDFFIHSFVSYHKDSKEFRISALFMVDSNCSGFGFFPGKCILRRNKHCKTQCT